MRTIMLLVAAVFAGCTTCEIDIPHRPEGCTVPVLNIYDMLGPEGRYRFIDEPFWRCDAVSCDSYASTPPVDVSAVATYVDAWPAVPHAEGRLAWINYSRPEIRWLSEGKIPAPSADYDLVSFDVYAGACGWFGVTLQHAEMMRAALPGRRLGIVVEPDVVVVARAVDYACKVGFDAVIVYPGPF